MRRLAICSDFMWQDRTRVLAIVTNDMGHIMVVHACVH
jgi:hypothetical protein